MEESKVLGIKKLAKGKWMCVHFVSPLCEIKTVDQIETSNKYLESCIVIDPQYDNKKLNTR